MKRVPRLNLRGTEAQVFEVEAPLAPSTKSQKNTTESPDLLVLCHVSVLMC